MIIHAKGWTEEAIWVLTCGKIFERNVCVWVCVSVCVCVCVSTYIFFCPLPGPLLWPIKPNSVPWVFWSKAHHMWTSCWSLCWASFCGSEDKGLLVIQLLLQANHDPDCLSVASSYWATWKVLHSLKDLCPPFYTCNSVSFNCWEFPFGKIFSKNTLSTTFKNR